MLWFDVAVATAVVYLGTGWFLLVNPVAFVQALDGVEFALLAAGGLLYTGGAVMFFLRRPDPWPATFGYHEIWHTCVVVAAFCHWLSVYMLAE